MPCPRTTHCAGTEKINGPVVHTTGPGQLTYAEPRLIVSQLVYAFTHFFTGLEVRHDLGGNFDSISALRITPNARRTVIERKASKATDFNPAALC